MSKLEELIAELEKAAGPSRDFDWRIAQITNLPEVWPETAFWPPFMAGSKFDKAIPLFTASIDAAVALVERMLPDWRIENLCEWDHERLRERGPWMCDLVERGKDCLTGKSAKCAHAPTPAMALSIAALKAKLSQMEA
ncbi:hypothetical protein [Rhizobium miluonense]|uniref:Uncharacterized protein n=1 Tax=Rhizobium miluonense TaxID=411945 RepID=A0ABU1SM09_9HYPH|nr:hypothetical protein [Rhizobium miluonense]MDR6900002.1 hypothetical protein [Rhizobium miluonense]